MARQGKTRDRLGRRAALSSIVVAGAVAAHAAGPRIAEGTREMAVLLAERAAAVDPMKLPYLVNDRRADAMARTLDEPLPLNQRFSRRFAYATELVNAGRFADAHAAIDALRKDAEALGPEAWQRAGPMLLLLKAVAHLRQGEQDNCNLAMSSQSCLLPIRGTGVHARTEGATRSVEVLREVLALEPDNLRARWLLNIAHMTLGGYPDGVPERWRIPPAAFAAEHPLPRFPNVAHEAGLRIHGLSGGAVLDDLDGDGRLDLMVSSIGFDDPLRVFHNAGSGRFEERSAAAGLAGITGGLNLIQADYDNDGRTDVLVLRGGWFGSEGAFPFSLVRNLGGGAFADVTKAAGLVRYAPSQTAVWLDYDGDGWLDLFVGNESSPDAAYPCQLFRNERNGTFTERAAETGVDVVAFVKGVVSADYDDDGRPDLYLSLGGGDNLLFHNDGPTGDPPRWRFTDRARAAGVTEPRNSFPALFFDYDNDGDQDLFVGGFGAMAEDVAADYLGLPTTAERPRLYRSRGDGTFEDVTRAAGLHHVMSAMGLNAGDLDNDGFLDVYVGTGNPDLSSLQPNRMFRNDAGRRFHDVTTAGDFGHLQKGHGIAFGDVDDDGDQDVFEEMGGAVTTDTAHSVLFANPGHGNGWVELTLEGVKSNRSAIGARLVVTVEGPSGQRRIHRTVGTGGSFGGGPLRQHVGLGDAKRIVSVEVTWPATGQRQPVAGVEPGHRYRIREGAPRAQPADRKAFRLPGS